MGFLKILLGLTLGDAQQAPLRMSGASDGLSGLLLGGRVSENAHDVAYSKGQKNDFRDAEAIAEAVQRPTMKFVRR
ncbi:MULTISPECIES: hypothetical protein [Bradyrhizobium]|uniref:hypothetical protein n=1 Tax=Bradyrhizobium centrosematis TaxID=1300039 RepID=UPI002169C054|nr:hypothetical protein [Bradyrhizobium centrosematis]MCS3765775.1 hypothetical protein [Bradyrhizobium centrosematis]MCS3778001.1 hypothetical protein [Bradyrhizobium centrosematis]